MEKHRNPLEKLLGFLADLVEFFADGHLEVEIFGKSEGDIGGEEMLARLFDEFGD